LSWLANFYIFQLFSNWSNIVKMLHVIPRYPILGARKIFCTYIYIYILESPKKCFKSLNLLLTFQNKWNIFFIMGILSFPLAFQINLCYIIWTSKNTPKVSLIITSFFRGLRMKMNPINQKNNVRMFITSILKCLKKN